VAKRTVSSGLGSLGSGAVTAVALAVQTGLAAVVGVIIAREFGRTAATDGFFASYGVFIVVVLAATAIRIAVLPALARARDEDRLGSEVAAYGLTLALLGVPLLALALFGAHPFAALLTGHGPAAARETAAATLPWMIAASVLQLYAGLAASSLAALDDYRVASAGYILGSAAGLAYILVRVHPDGIPAVAHGMAVNGAVAAAVPTLALALRARREAMPRRALLPSGLSFGDRVREVGVGVSLPLTLQFVYLICLPLASRVGVGATTSFGYAYLLTSAIVSVAALSLGLVTSVPLTRVELEPVGIAKHVVASSWIAFILIGAAAGIFGIAGGKIVRVLLGEHYGASVGSELGRLVLVMSIWAVASVGVSVTFPLVFVVGSGGRLPLLAATALALHVPIAFAGEAIGGLDGLALALALTTGLILVGLLTMLRSLEPVTRGIGVAVLTVAVLAAAGFVPAWLLLGRTAAAVVGALVYAALLAGFRPPGLRAAWGYLRTLS
jgi:hypothetical protein